ncbi:MAG: short-chain dehydrogenase [Gammaproteobacteria bacterium]|nr:short-chain dehydrogenase [Gammaproteobacteria bacterium]|tara:strand:- start:2237 stop:3040 length:804 start_codon:yes stop_codon:yes gene_type:complete
MADLRGKVAVVTGATRGVGRGIAEGLAEAGATVYLTGRTTSADEPPAPGSLEATAREVEALGGTPVPLRVDHERDDQVRRLFEQVRAAHGRLDLLVNNAYRLPDASDLIGRFWEQPLSVWDDHCGVGTRGYYVAAALAAPLMIEAGRGLIVNVSSAGGAGYAVNTAYGTGKAAVERMARDMAFELAGRGVAALALRPGLVRTEFVEAAVAAGRLRADLASAESPRFVGRCIAALAMDPDVMEKTGGAYRVSDLAREYRFTDPDRPSA